MSLAQIKAFGTTRPDFSSAGKPLNTVRCVDGFKLSVIAGAGTYCSPRPGFGAPAEFDGPYVAAEVGYPSARPEPWDKWSEFAESPSDPTGTVYGWVPFELIEALIASHGGEQS